jgi:hypothetical protein
MAKSALLSLASIGLQVPYSYIEINFKNKEDTIENVMNTLGLKDRFDYGDIISDSDVFIFSLTESDEGEFEFRSIHPSIFNSDSEKELDVFVHVFNNWTPATLSLPETYFRGDDGWVDLFQDIGEGDKKSAISEAMKTLVNMFKFYKMDTLMDENAERAKDFLRSGPVPESLIIEKLKNRFKHLNDAHVEMLSNKVTDIEALENILDEKFDLHDLPPRVETREKLEKLDIIRKRVNFLKRVEKAEAIRFGPDKGLDDLTANQREAVDMVRELAKEGNPLEVLPLEILQIIAQFSARQYCVLCDSAL